MLFLLYFIIPKVKISPMLSLVYSDQFSDKAWDNQRENHTDIYNECILNAHDGCEALLFDDKLYMSISQL